MSLAWEDIRGVSCGGCRQRVFSLSESHYLTKVVLCFCYFYLCFLVGITWEVSAIMSQPHYSSCHAFSVMMNPLNHEPKYILSPWGCISRTFSCGNEKSDQRTHWYLYCAWQEPTPQGELTLLPRLYFLAEKLNESMWFVSIKRKCRGSKIAPQFIVKELQTGFKWTFLWHTQLLSHVFAWSSS